MFGNYGYYYYVVQLRFGPPIAMLENLLVSTWYVCKRMYLPLLNRHS